MWGREVWFNNLTGQAQKQTNKKARERVGLESRHLSDSEYRIGIWASYPDPRYTALVCRTLPPRCQVLPVNPTNDTEPRKVAGAPSPK